MKDFKSLSALSHYFHLVMSCAMWRFFGMAVVGDMLVDELMDTRYR